MTSRVLVITGVLALSGAASAQISTLSAKIAVDNAFDAYLSTSATTLGTSFVSGSNWPQTFSGSININTGGTYFLHVRARDQGLPAMFIGQFDLTGTQATFVSTGTQNLLTNVNNFVATMGANPGATPAFIIDEGANGTSPWGMFNQINANARFIWANDANGHNISGDNNPVYFTTQINVVPEPSTLAFLALGALALIRRRR